MTPKFGAVRVIEYAGTTVTVMALAHGPIPYISDEGTSADENKIAVLVLAHGGAVPSPYYPLHGTATCLDAEWLEGTKPE